VALAGVICLGGRELWLRWLRRDYRNPVSPSQLSARAGQYTELVWNPDRSVPVTIKYDFRFASPKPPPGAACKLLAEIWFEDLTSGSSVDGYTFDVLLTVSGRETASETFNWDAVLPSPGSYHLRYILSWYTPSGELRLANGGGMLYRVVADPLSGHQVSRSGAEP
jgi:hypothetical protein